jgi:hypothetical protein
MGKSLKYVKDFDFSSAGKTVGMAMGGKACYAEGGKADIAQDKAMIRTAVHKHERSMHPGKPMTKLARGGKMQPAMSAMARKEIMATPTMQKREVVQRESVKAPASPLGMLRDNSRLGIEGNKNPGIRRKSVPVAPREPMLPAFKSGGLMSDKGAKKVERVMSEYKAGELHSGSKTGPVVKNPKQAVAIALSEARNVGKKKK